MAGDGDVDSDDSTSALPNLASLAVTPSASTQDAGAKAESNATPKGNKLWSAREAKLRLVVAKKPVPEPAKASTTPKSSTRTVFGKFRRSSAGSKAELALDVPQSLSRRSSASHAEQQTPVADKHKDVEKSTSNAQSEPARSSSGSGCGAEDVVETVEDVAAAGGGFVDDVRERLELLLVQLDSVDAKKLVAVRLGGELRGLLGKAQDEFAAYETEFLQHAGGDGVSVALRNFAASLEQVSPIAERLRGAKFLLNKKFKREVLFAFQEINSYYTTLFVELSMAVAKRSGLALPLPVPEPVSPPPLPIPEPEPVEEAGPSPDNICLEAHAHFFGHGVTRDLRRALELYLQAADLGSAQAMTCLGQMYAGGLGAEQDILMAEKWLHLATSAGEVEACHQLCRLLCEKAAHEKSPARVDEMLSLARVRCSQAAEQGHREAQYELGEFHKHGRGGCNPDETQAAVWYSKAAEQGHAQAEASLGRLHLEGSQTEPDVAKAVHFLQRAAAKNDVSAQTHLGKLYTTGDGVKPDLDRGVAFLRQAAGAGNCEAMTRLAKLLLLHSPSNEAEDACSSAPLPFSEQFGDREEAHDEALRLLLNAGSSGYPEAHFTLGELLEKSSLLRDRAAALRFYTKAATALPHHTKAAKRVAAMYYSGIGCSVDKWKSHRFYAIAARAGDAEALNALGLMFEEGEGCDLNYLKAAECYRSAVELESPHAHFNLGCLLSHGKGVERNVDAAQVHFRQAAALGYTLAQQFLLKQTQ